MKTSLVVLAFSVAASAAFGAPAFGTQNGDYASRADVGQKCFLYNSFDRAFFPNGVTPITIFVDDTFAPRMADHYLALGKAPGAFPHLSESQIHAVVQSAMEEWNLNARGPLLRWGGKVNLEIRINGGEIETRCADAESRLPSPSVVITWQPAAPGAAPDAIGGDGQFLKDMTTGDECAGGAGCDVSRCRSSRGPELPRHSRPSGPRDRACHRDGTQLREQGCLGP